MKGFKGKVISDHHEGILQEQLAEMYCISQSLVSKWLNKKDEILKEASDKTRKNLTKMRRGTKYLELYGALLNELKEARRKGYAVQFNWLWCKATKIYRQQKKDPNTIIRKHVIQTFLRRHNIRMRARQ